MFTKNSDFDETIKKEWPSPVMYDGITNMEQYKNSNPKILWILKETNENGNGEDRNHREFHENVTVYAYWKRTYKKIILSTYGLINNVSFSDMLFFANDKNLCGHYDILNQIAFINVNKTGATSQSKNCYISKYYQKHKDTLLTQVDEIAPDVIINCSRVGAFFDDLSEHYNLTKQVKKTTDNWIINYANNGKKLLIDYWHPNAKIEDDWYCTQIIDIYNNWKSNQ